MVDDEQEYFDIDFHIEVLKAQLDVVRNELNDANARAQQKRLEQKRLHQLLEHLISTKES